MYKYIVWLTGIISAFRFWGTATWLSIIVLVLAFSVGVRKNEQKEHTENGVYSNFTATRLALTTGLVGIIFIISLFI